MRSLDVLHSLFLVNLRLKQDLVPGMEVRGWFEATKTTAEARKERKDDTFDYEIACAELCGTSHHAMRGKIVIYSAADYAAWEAKRRQDQEEINLDVVQSLWRDFWEYAGGKPLGEMATVH